MYRAGTCPVCGDSFRVCEKIRGANPAVHALAPCPSLRARGSILKASHPLSARAQKGDLRVAFLLPAPPPLSRTDANEPVEAQFGARAIADLARGAAFATMGLPIRGQST